MIEIKHVVDNHYNVVYNNNGKLITGRPDNVTIVEEVSPNETRVRDEIITDRRYNIKNINSDTSVMANDHSVHADHDTIEIDLDGNKKAYIRVTHSVYRK